MPGIVGIIGRSAEAHWGTQVEDMVKVMRHEPFCVYGTYASPKTGICCGWVAQEKSFASQQVFLSAAGDVALIFSGECFFKPETRALLHGGGQQPTETTNGSWLIPLYLELDKNFFEHLNGLFSGLLIDQRRGKAFLFNDRYGMERIYWHENKEAFYFASEAKALLSILPELRQFDDIGVAQFLAAGCTFNCKTLFRNIHLLPGGSLVEFQNGTGRQKQYFSSQTWENQTTLDELDYESQFEETFNRVLPRYFDSSSSIGISLTGGLDTRMVLASRPKSDKELVAYTFTGDRQMTLDDRIAARVAGTCGLNHHMIRLRPDFFSDFASHADRTIYLTDGSFGITGAHEVYFNQVARRLAEVRVTGLFGSEILRGISTFKPLGLVTDLLNPDFASKVTATTLEIQSYAHPITRAAFQDVPWNLFGSFAASRSQVTVRTPFLDNDLVAVAFRVPGTLRRSAQPALRLIKNNYPALSRIPTDRRIEDRTARFPKHLRRIFFESIFKLDYLYNEGMLPWLSPVDAILRRVNPALYLFGHHKFLQYPRWLSRELAGFLREAMANPRIQESRFWNHTFLRNIVADHTNGRRNYVREINAILTLAAVERLLLTNLRYPIAATNEVNSRSTARLVHRAPC